MDMNNLLIEKTKPQKEYELIDSGEGEKLERYGAFVIARPDPQALWAKRLPQAEWDKADAYYKREGMKGKWVKRQEEAMPPEWQAKIGSFTFAIELSPFKHTGVFPEQLSNWEWIAEKIKKEGRSVKILNLFGYTGGATLAAASAGAEVTHVDASKTTIGRAKKNAESSGLGAAKIRWILDDAYKFVEREARRGNRYDAIIMDPPSYGRGARNETWKIEESLASLLGGCRKILSKDPIFFILNGYSSGYSAIAYKNNLELLMGGTKGEIEAGELAIEDVSGRLLPAGIFVRWAR